MVDPSMPVLHMPTGRLRVGATFSESRVLYTKGEYALLLCSGWEVQMCVMSCWDIPWGQLRERLSVPVGGAALRLDITHLPKAVCVLSHSKYSNSGGHDKVSVCTVVLVHIMSHM